MEKMLQDIPKIQHTDVATIRFSGGAVDCSDSESDSGLEDEMSQSSGGATGHMEVKLNVDEHRTDINNYRHEGPHSAELSIGTDTDDSKRHACDVPTHDNDKRHVTDDSVDFVDHQNSVTSATTTAAVMGGRFNPFDNIDMNEDRPFCDVIVPPQDGDTVRSRANRPSQSNNREHLWSISSNGTSEHSHNDSAPLHNDSTPLHTDSASSQSSHTHHNDSNAEVSNAELGLAEDHFALPENDRRGAFGLTTVEELQMAIDNCKDLIASTEVNTDRHKSLVTKLIQLRMKQVEAKEKPVNTDDDDCVLLAGHEFRRRTSKSSKHYCEKCASVIWGVMQAWYKCTVCGFCVHMKCLNIVTRKCAQTKVLEKAQYILSICPEQGLSAQRYRCAECRTQIAFRPGFREPRQCDYTGLYYCDICHWNDTMIIPARVLHNWDLDPRKVCRASKQYLRLMLLKSVIRIQDINPMLFTFVQELNEIKKLREELLIMKRYFVSCKAALRSKLLLQLQDRQHFVENSDMYTLNDILLATDDSMLGGIAKIHASFAQHIKTDCELCRVKGYICELCGDNSEVLFPFDSIAIVCSTCSTVLHRHCYMKKNRHCPKCERLTKRHSITQLEDSINDISLNSTENSTNQEAHNNVTTIVSSDENDLETGSPDLQTGSVDLQTGGDCVDSKDSTNPFFNDAESSTTGRDGTNPFYTDSKNLFYN